MPFQGNLFERLSAAAAKVKTPALVALAEDATLPIALLHDICYDQKHGTVAFRAAWVLEHIATHYPDRFMPIFDAFLSRLPEQRNVSCQRHFTKIVMCITHPKAPKPYQNAFATIDHEQLVEILFSWLIAPRAPVAVQVNCIAALFNMCDEIKWLAAELKQQTAFLLKDGSAAMQSRGKKIMAKLARSKF
ncbi:hypothetical protein [Parapedobacter koreensis]|uniref:DNA alkylation repair enzyme n=1 Tax=Parapedobacter koreensis TaxID=332977 RepID=A0A1H7JZG6_9SPHI|nr:hypothetical protein [Parapedobacter koreensis]SEK79147.1 hypothetical protein SAMN05421740_102705 [Parapedobacter koreensis]